MLPILQFLAAVLLIAIIWDVARETDAKAESPPPDESNDGDFSADAGREVPGRTPKMARGDDMGKVSRFGAWWA